MATSNDKKRAASWESKVPTPLKKSSPLPDDAKVAAMAGKCLVSMRKFRNMRWTDYARINHHLVNHNFGIGLEPAIKCFGCRRLLPPSLITGDHMAEKSNKDALIEAIAVDLDGFIRNDYIACLEESPVKTGILNPLRATGLRTIRSYDDGLATDLRNIQPLCWSCNTKKGNRQGVDLFPQYALIGLLSHEAPF